VTLPAFAAEHQHVARSAHVGIDRYLPPAGRSAANPPAAVAAVDRRDRETHGTDADLAPLTMQPASMTYSYSIRTTYVSKNNVYYTCRMRLRYAPAMSAASCIEHQDFTFPCTGRVLSRLVPGRGFQHEIELTSEH